MTRYGLALVIIRSMAVAVGVYVLTKIDLLIVLFRQMFWKSPGEFGPLSEWWLYLSVPLVIVVIGFMLWLTARRIARGIAEERGADAGGKFSADEAMLMRLLLMGLGMTTLVLTLADLPTLFAQFFWMRHSIVPPGGSVDAMGISSNTQLAKTLILLAVSVVLILGKRPISRSLMRLRKFD